LGGVAPGERYCVLFGEGEEAGEEVVEPLLFEVGRESEGEEGGEGFGTHGGEVRETSGEAAMAGGTAGEAGWEPVAAEVAGFEGEVGGDEDFVAGGWGEDGAVVADAEAEGARGARGGGLADTGDEGELGEGGRHRAGFLSLRGMLRDCAAPLPCPEAGHGDPELWLDEDESRTSLDNPPFPIRQGRMGHPEGSGLGSNTIVGHFGGCRG
jgi:hypothetical protein